MWFVVCSLGFGVWGSGFRVRGAGSGVFDLDHAAVLHPQVLHHLAIMGCYVTIFAPHKASKLIAFGQVDIW